MERTDGDGFDQATWDGVERLQHLVDGAHRIVFFGGAGVSTESGIPDFRSTDGLYHQRFKYPPEVMLSRSFFDAHPAEFFDFHCRHLVHPEAKPNAAHRKLAEMERLGRLLAVVTQNIDGLHQAAGSHHVVELHGNVGRGACMTCGKVYPLGAMCRIVDGPAGTVSEGAQGADGLPRCADDGGLIKPDVVLYEEPLKESSIRDAVDAIGRADMLIIGGTSLNVYPAAGLIDYYHGHDVVIINRDPTPADATATVLIKAPIAQVLDHIVIR